MRISVFANKVIVCIFRKILRFWILTALVNKQIFDRRNKAAKTKLKIGICL